MSNNQLVSIYKLDFYKRQRNWRLAGASSKAKEPNEAKNRSELNKTYIVNQPLPQEVVETPKLDEGFNDDQEKSNPELKHCEATEKKSDTKYNNAENNEFNENFLRDRILTDAIIRENYEKQNFYAKTTGVSDNEWIEAAKINGQIKGINSDDTNLLANDINDGAHCFQNLNRSWSNVEMQEDFVAPEVSGNLGASKWSSEGEGAVADMSGLYGGTRAELSCSSSLDSGKFKLGADAAPHSSERNLAFKLPPRPSEAFMKTFCEVRERFLREKHDMQIQAYSRASQYQQWPTWAVSPNVPRPSLIRQATFTCRPNSGPICATNWQNYATAGQHFNNYGQYFNNYGRHFNNYGQHFNNYGHHFNNYGQHFNNYGQSFNNNAQGINNANFVQNNYGQHLNNNGQGINNANCVQNNYGQHFNNNGQGINNPNCVQNNYGQHFNNIGQGINNANCVQNNNDQRFSQIGQNSTNSAFYRGSYDGITRSERVILRGGRPYRVYN